MPQRGSEDRKLFILVEAELPMVMDDRRLAVFGTIGIKECPSVSMLIEVEASAEVMACGGDLVGDA